MINGVYYNGDSLDLNTTIAMPGDIVECIISATDDYGVSVTDSTQIVIDNRMPTISQITIDNVNPTSNDVVTCSIQATDPDGETLIESFDWLLSNNVIATGATIDLSTVMVMPNDVVTCSATVTDPMLSVDQGTTAMTVINSLPVIDAFTITPQTHVECLASMR